MNQLRDEGTKHILPYLSETDDCHCGASYHEADADDEEKVKDLVFERALGKPPV